MSGRLYLGLDLGYRVDPTSLAIVEPWRDRLALTAMKTWKPLRSDFLDVAEIVADVLRRQGGPERPALGIDARGIGRDFALMAIDGQLGELADVFPLLPTFSTRPHRQLKDGFTFVSKSRLLASLFGALDTGRLVLARGLGEAAALRTELEGLRVLPTRGGIGETIGAAPGGGRHDDRVMALGYAFFLAETLPGQGLVNAIRPVRFAAGRC